jgi:phosphohistidine phosphatase
MRAMVTRSCSSTRDPQRVAWRDGYHAAMHLILFRHGLAQDKNDPDCPADAERRLTSKGIARTKKAARGLLRLGVAPDVVVSSPYLRARETAEIAIDELGLELDLVESEALLPEASPEDLVRFVGRQKVDVVLCAGHAPHLDLVVARLLGAEGAVTALDKAGAVSLDVPRGGKRGRIEWLLDCGQLRRVKK